MTDGAPVNSSANSSARTPATKNVLYIRHDPDAQPGYVGERLSERGYVGTDLPVARSLTDANITVDFGDPGRYDMIVPLGSIWSVYDTDTIGTWIGDELEFLAEAHSRRIPIFGVCFGGQALAAALGGTVEPASRPEVGWRTISSDRPDVLAEGPWMEWHYDRFTVPDGATELARNESGSQAFAVDRSFGTQFHPEVSPAIVNGWLDDAPPSELAKPGVDPAAIRRDTERLAPKTREKTFRLVDWFVDEVATR